MTDLDRRHVYDVRGASRRGGWRTSAMLLAATAVLATLVVAAVSPAWERAASAPVVIAPQATAPVPASPSATASASAPPAQPALSADRKSLVAGGQILLAIDDDRIVAWFRTDSQLCDQRNINTTANRRMFCEDRASFKSLTQFASLTSSPDGMRIGFTIESATLAPDTAAGILLPATATLRFLTTYYLGHEFISFSPAGTNYIYQANCFEAKCGLVIGDSTTLAQKASLNPAAERHPGYGATFVRWISDNEIEYKLGAEVKRHSF